jgi:hypothetical protein
MKRQKTEKGDAVAQWLLSAEEINDKPTDLPNVFSPARCNLFKELKHAKKQICM